MPFEHQEHCENRGKSEERGRDKASNSQQSRLITEERRVGSGGVERSKQATAEELRRTQALGQQSERDRKKKRRRKSRGKANNSGRTETQSNEEIECEKTKDER